jgi:hypothetical protein
LHWAIILKIEVPPDAAMMVNAKIQSKFVNSYSTASRMRAVFLVVFSKLRKATINLDIPV